MHVTQNSKVSDITVQARYDYI